MFKKICKVALVLSLVVPMHIEARKCKTFCQLIVQNCLRVLGSEVITGNLTVGSGTSGNLSVAGTASFGGPVTIGTCVLTCTAAGLAVTTPAGTAVTVSGLSAQYVQLGAQPTTVAAGQPFTYTTAVLTTPGIIASTGTFAAFPAGSGTVFQLTNIGRYEVNFQSTYTTDGGIVLYTGPTLGAGAMLPLPYTMVGKTPNGQASNSVIIQTTTANSFLAVVSAPGNATPIIVPANSSTTNQNATTVSIKQIA